MAKNVGRLFLFRSTAVTSSRQLSTAPATAATVIKKMNENSSLFYRLATLKATTNTEVSEILDEYVKNGHTISRFEIIGFATQLRKFKHYDQALQLYEWMDKSKNRMNNADHAVRIDLLAKTKGIDSAESYFNKLEKSGKTKKTYGALLNCYCGEAKLDKALELFQEMKKLNFVTGTLTYNNLMSLYMKVGQPEKLPAIVKEMEEKNITADGFTHSLLINSYAALKDFESMEAVMKKIEQNTKDDWFMYGNLATVYVNAGLLDKANATLLKMEKQKHFSDPEALHTLINLYGRTSNAAGVNRAWENLKVFFPKTGNRSYLIMLLALSKLGDVNGLEKIFKEWESSCSTYDVRLSNVVLESYLNRNMVREAESLYKSLETREVEPNLKTCTLFMNFHLKKKQVDLAFEFLERGVSKLSQTTTKWFPSQESVSAFFELFEEGKDVDGAEKFCKSMKKINRLDGKVYDFLLHTYITAGKVEPQMRQRMKEDGIEISTETEKLLHTVCP
ncbi:Pentatricopeptide repeat [Dillenia turbinata]|uniref:Pentatricopeptide repeat n=1 Tax=Dillenia turbinata TaxID=194707 RepID=A0AAN8UA38_9MAGN